MFTVYGQRDPRWAQKKIGQTQHTVAAIGCTTCCICMGGSFFNDTINPGEACKLLRYTQEGLILWNSIGVLFNNTEFEFRFYSPNTTCRQAARYFPEGYYKELNKTLIDDALASPDKVVMLNVDSGGHWVFALKRLFGTNIFWVADPWTGTKKIYRGVVGGAVLRRKKV